MSIDRHSFFVLVSTSIIIDLDENHTFLLLDLRFDQHLLSSYTFFDFCHVHLLRITLRKNERVLKKEIIYWNSIIATASLRWPLVSWKARSPFSLSLTHDVPSILDYLSSRVLRRFRLTITSAHLTLNVNDDKNQLVRWEKCCSQSVFVLRCLSVVFFLLIRRLCLIHDE